MSKLYLALESLFKYLNKQELADSAHAAAIMCANTLEKAFDEALGFIPVLENGTKGDYSCCRSLIYP